MCSKTWIKRSQPKRFLLWLTIFWYWLRHDNRCWPVVSRHIMLHSFQLKTLDAARLDAVVLLRRDQLNSPYFWLPRWPKYQSSCIWVASFGRKHSDQKLDHHDKFLKEFYAPKEKIASWLVGRQSFTIISCSNTHLHLLEIIRWYCLYQCLSIIRYRS